MLQERIEAEMVYYEEMKAGAVILKDA